jgi:hypothetical protein
MVKIVSFSMARLSGRKNKIKIKLNCTKKNWKRKKIIGIAKTRCDYVAPGKKCVVSVSKKIVHDKDINDSQGQDQEELMMKYFTSINVLLTCRKYTF